MPEYNHSKRAWTSETGFAVGAEGQETLIIDENGDFTGDVNGQVFGDVSTYDADGAIAVTDAIVQLDGSSEALAMTLADGTAGQRISIKCTDATNNCVVTPANFSDGTTLTFDAAGEYAELYFGGTNWQLLAYTATLA